METEVSNVSSAASNAEYLAYENQTAIEELKSKIDINLAANYNYNTKLSFFIELNNIAYQRYFNYYNYPSQRIVLMAGAKYAF